MENAEVWPILNGSPEYVVSENLSKVVRSGEKSRGNAFKIWNVQSPARWRRVIQIYEFQLCSWFYIRKYLKCYREFSYWLREYVFFLIQINKFLDHWLEPMWFLVFEGGVAPTFSNFGYLVGNWYEELLFAGEIAVSLKDIFWPIEYFELVFPNIAKIGLSTRN